MHSVSKLVADSDNYVAQDRVSAVGVGLYPNDVLVLYAKLLSSLGCEVDMALCYDNALLNRYLACRKCALRFYPVKFTRKSKIGRASCRERV